MKAIIFKGPGQVQLNEVPRPVEAASGHVIVKMQVIGINAGDKYLISGNAPAGFFPESRYGITGVSGVGKVIATGDDVPNKYLGKYVTVYRSLRFSDEIVGTWSEYAQLPYLACAILPDNVNPEDYSGSLVNIITPYAMWKQAIQEGHKGIINTAGNSSTGIAMLGICTNAGFPVISIVRNARGKRELEELGAEYVLIQGDENFQDELARLSNELNTTAVFDGVGGALLNDIIGVIPAGTTIYAYGFLGDNIPFSFHTSLLVKGITIKGFNNFRTDTVQNSAQLEQALEAIGSMIHLPHFKFKSAKTFALKDIEEAISFSSVDGGKVVLQVTEE